MPKRKTKKTIKQANWKLSTAADFLKVQEEMIAQIAAEQYISGKNLEGAIDRAKVVMLREIQDNIRPERQEGTVNFVHSIFRQQARGPDRVDLTDKVKEHSGFYKEIYG